MIINDGGGIYKPKSKVKTRRVKKHAPSARVRRKMAEYYRRKARQKRTSEPEEETTSSNVKRTVRKNRVKPKRRVRPKKSRPKKSRPKRSKSKGSRGKGKKKGGKKRKKRKKKKIKVRRPKTNPTPPKETVKTAPTPKPVEVTIINDESYQQGEIINAYLAMAAIELFQHTNATSVDGMVSDVNIINVISTRRRQYTANRLIDLAGAMIRRVWISNGFLYLDVEDSVSGSWEICNLQFDIIESTPDTKYQVIETREDNVYS